MAEAIVSVVLDSLNEFISDEDYYSLHDPGEDNLMLLKEFCKQFTKLEVELQGIKSLLKDADARQDEDMVRTWVRMIRSLAYRAEDLVEKHAVHHFVLKKKEPIVIRLFRKFGFMQSKVSKVRKVVSSEIYDVTKEVAHLKETLEIYGIEKEKEVNVVDERQRFLRITLSEEDEGFVDSKDDLGSLVSVIKNTNEHKIVSLSGMGGSGKTTMARKIYNHEKVRKWFDVFAWVCITQDCEIRTIKVELLKQLTDKQDVWNVEDDVLKTDIQNVMQKKKCLVVIDDIWRMSNWEELRSCFPDRKAKWNSKILLTTRNGEIAKIGFHHRQQLFNEPESLELLKQKVPVQMEDSSFKNLGRKMLSKCGGLPLAIAALGVTLSTKFSLEEWEMGNRDFSSALPLSLGDGDTISRRLGLSYDDLPHYLKPCFLYMSIFGNDDQNIDPKRLYHLWIAEGLIPRYLPPSSQAETSMDVAEKYLKELSSRGMVQVEEDPISGRVSTCQLHCTMRDLCLRKAQQEDFLDVQNTDSRDNSNNVRRLAIRSEDDGTFVEPVDHITCLIIRALSISSVQQEGNHSRGKKHAMDASVAEKLKLLRVLDFEGYRFFEKKLPGRIAELIHLRYLSLCGCDVTEFPASVGNLPLLLTLDLRTIGSIKIPHDVFSKKKRLKHLYLNKFHCGPLLKLQINDLTKLESLILGETVCDVDLKHLSNLVNIQCFEADAISNQNEYTEIMAQIKGWKKIKLLKVGMSNVEGKTLGNALELNNLDALNKLKVGEGSLPKLVTLSIGGCEKLEIQPEDGC